MTIYYIGTTQRSFGFLHDLCYVLYHTPLPLIDPSIYHGHVQHL